MRDRSETQMTLVLLRHGATRANAEHRYLGKTDEPLSREGAAQLTAAKSLHLYPRLDALFASPMKRCVQTAEILYPKLHPILIKEWTEIDFGAFEGKNHAELREDARYQAWIDSQGTLPFPEGESRSEFLMRCGKGLHSMLQIIGQTKKEKRPKTVGLVVHGGTIMALLSQYGAGAYFDYQSANGDGYRCILTYAAAEPELVRIEPLAVFLRKKWELER